MSIEELVNTVYSTLLHSLWQGAAIALVAGILMILTKRWTSSVRYNLLVGSMAFFVLGITITFIHFMPSGNDIFISRATTGAVSPEAPVNLYTAPLDQLFSILSSYSNRIVLLWFLVICLKSIRLYLDLQGVIKLKTKQTFDAGSYWNSLTETLSRKLQIQRTVQLFESRLTSIPLTVGYLKPVILVPIGMLAALPSDQIEAILLHELAHIKRKDYFINIFQSMIEVVFFFNPAIWWLSSQIRAERENCCDDIAVANSNSKINYVKALVAFEDYRQKDLAMTVSFGGQKNTLLARAKRILYNENKTLNSMEKFILTSGLVLSGLLSMAFTDNGRKQLHKTLKPVVASITENFPATRSTFAAVTDTVVAPRAQGDTSLKQHQFPSTGTVEGYALVHNGTHYRFKVKDGKVADLFVNDQKIDESKIVDYATATATIIQRHKDAELSAQDAERQSDQAKIEAENAVKRSEIAKKISDEIIQAKLKTEVGSIENSGPKVSFDGAEMVITNDEAKKTILFGKNKVIEITTRELTPIDFEAAKEIALSEVGKTMTAPIPVFKAVPVNADPVVVPAIKVSPETSIKPTNAPKVIKAVPVSP